RSRSQRKAGRTSEPEGDRNGSELVRLVLTVELLGPEDMGVCQPDPREGDGDSGLCIADEVLLVDAAAVFEGVSVEEDVSGDGPPLDAGEQVPAETLCRDEEVGSRKARPDPRRPVIGGKILSDPQHEPGRGVSVDVADAAPDVRRDVRAEPE